MSAHDPEAADDYSNPEAPRTIPSGAIGAVGSVLAALGFAGVVLAFAATFSTVIKVQVLTVTTARYTGYDRYSVALIVLGVFALLMLVGGLRGARPALLALALAGLAVLLISILKDLPHLNDSGVWPLHDQYEDAQASAGAGYYLETASGVLLLLSGVGLAFLGPARPRRPGAGRAADGPPAGRRGGTPGRPHRGGRQTTGSPRSSAPVDRNGRRARLDRPRSPAWVTSTSVETRARALNQRARDGDENPMPSSTPFTVSAGLGPAHARSGGLEIHYEPVADLASGAVTGAEALLRRRMPGGVVQIAARFLPEAEANGLLVGIGRRVVDRACEQAAGWQSSRRGATVTVNLSALELADPGVVDWVEAVITRHALPAELLILDVPEVLVARAALDGGAHLQHLRELAGLGVRIAVDDVGTGAAAPTYLPLVPASVLKIDGRTVRALDRSPESPLVAALAALGHELGLRVLAEGVEHEELLPRLHELGCDLAQGYAIGRATSPNRIAALLRG